MAEPFYSDNHVRLYLGDCRELVEWLAADVLVTDPPYGIDGHLSFSYKGRKPPSGHARRHAAPTWDTGLAARDSVLAAWGDRPYAVFGSPARLDGAPPHREFPLVWDKLTIGMGDTSFPWGRGYELIYVNGRGWVGRRESPVIRISVQAPMSKDRPDHPTPKPVELMRLLLAKAPAGTVADPFAGSGSTLVAAKELGRRAIGVEIDERYAEIAARRLSQDCLDLGA